MALLDAPVSESPPGKAIASIAIIEALFRELESQDVLSAAQVRSVLRTAWTLVSGYSDNLHDSARETLKRMLKERGVTV